MPRPRELRNDTERSRATVLESILGAEHKGNDACIDGNLKDAMKFYKEAIEKIEASQAKDLNSLFNQPTSSSVPKGAELSMNASMSADLLSGNMLNNGDTSMNTDLSHAIDASNLLNASSVANTSNSRDDSTTANDNLESTIDGKDSTHDVGTDIETAGESRLGLENPTVTQIGFENPTAAASALTSALDAADSKTSRVPSYSLCQVSDEAKRQYDQELYRMKGQLLISLANCELDLMQSYGAHKTASAAVKCLTSGQAPSTQARLIRARAITHMERREEMYYDDEQEHDALIAEALTDLHAVIHLEPTNQPARNELAFLEHLTEKAQKKAPLAYKGPVTRGNGNATTVKGLKRSSSDGNLGALKAWVHEVEDFVRGEEEAGMPVCEPIPGFEILGPEKLRLNIKARTTAGRRERSNGRLVNGGEMKSSGRPQSPNTMGGRPMSGGNSGGLKRPKSGDGRRDDKRRPSGTESRMVLISKGDSSQKLGESQRGSNGERPLSGKWNESSNRVDYRPMSPNRLSGVRSPGMRNSFSSSFAPPSGGSRLKSLNNHASNSVLSTGTLPCGGIGNATNSGIDSMHDDNNASQNGASHKNLPNYMVPKNLRPQSAKRSFSNSTRAIFGVSNPTLVGGNIDNMTTLDGTTVGELAGAKMNPGMSNGGGGGSSNLHNNPNRRPASAAGRLASLRKKSLYSAQQLYTDGQSNIAQFLLLDRKRSGKKFSMKPIDPIENPIETEKGGENLDDLEREMQDFIIDDGDDAALDGKVGRSLDEIGTPDQNPPRLHSRTQSGRSTRSAGMRRANSEAWVGNMNMANRRPFC